MLYSFLKPGVFPDSTLSSEQPIPRKIWQTCKDKKSMHPQLSQCISSLKEMNPNWAHSLFDDESQYEFMNAVCSERFLNAYERIQPLHGAARADIFRYLVVFLHGGAYFDLKSGTTRPLDEILRPYDSFILSQWDNAPNGRFPRVGIKRELKGIPGGEYEQWLVIASPGHLFLAATIEQVLHNIESYNAFKFGHGGNGVLNVCGPHAYTLAIYPLLQKYHHRKIKSWKEGICYTMLENNNSHQKLFPTHYRGHLIAPVTSRGLKGKNWIKYWFAEFAFWPHSRLSSLNYIRLQKRRQKRLQKNGKLLR